MSNVINLDEYKAKRKKKKETDPSIVGALVPVCTFCKGSYTLAIKHLPNNKCLSIVYNTTTKIVMAKEIAPYHGDPTGPKKWAEAFVHEWEVQHGRAED